MLFLYQNDIETGARSKEDIPNKTKQILRKLNIADMIIAINASLTVKLFITKSVYHRIINSLYQIYIYIKKA